MSRSQYRLAWGGGRTNGDGSQPDIGIKGRKASEDGWLKVERVRQLGHNDRLKVGKKENCSTKKRGELK